ncbi:MAG: hypothetical protein HUK09_00280 [Bacteroidaceae bacterium]|nr:hypothetical protein [Bacteroidaceae bacterium]
MPLPNYNSCDAASIFGHSALLMGRSLAETMQALDCNFAVEQLVHPGKGSLGTMVEAHFFGYTPNSDPRPDFPEAGVELKVTPLRQGRTGLHIKERLVIDMINYMTVVEESFEESMLYRKFLLMLLLFYVHEQGVAWRDMQFVFSVLWAIKDEDLEIIRQDYETIVDKVRRGQAHLLSESDTYYLSASTKGANSQSMRQQPCSSEPARSRAFSLKPSYMRTILEFAQAAGQPLSTNTAITPARKQLVSTHELREARLEDILTQRFAPYLGMDYKQMAERLQMIITPREKSKYARVAKRILLEGLNSFDEADEIHKAGIIAKTIRVESNGRIQEHMSFENIDFAEVLETDDWTDSRWYEIVHSRMMLIVFRRSDLPEWGDENRYVLERVLFATLPQPIIDEAAEFWYNIKANVMADKLFDANETDDPSRINQFWRSADGHHFHVRPKARNSQDKVPSPVSGSPVRKKCYWLSSAYLRTILQTNP